MYDADSINAGGDGARGGAAGTLQAGGRCCALLLCAAARGGCATRPSVDWRASGSFQRILSKSVLFTETFSNNSLAENRAAPGGSTPCLPAGKAAAGVGFMSWHLSRAGGMKVKDSGFLSHPGKTKASHSDLPESET